LRPIYIPIDIHRFVFIRHPLQRKIRPLFLWNKGLQFETVAELWLKANKVLNDNIRKSGVIIEFATRIISFQPKSSHLILVFTNVGLAIHHMRCRILLHSLIKISFCNLFSMLIIRQEVSHTAQGLATGKWPYRAIPFTTMSRSACPKSRFSAFSGCQTPGRLKSSGIDHLCPSFGIASLIGYGMKTPGDKPYRLTGGMQFAVF